MIFEAPLMKRLHGSGLGTGTSSKQAASISPDEKAMLWSSQQFGTLTTHETSRNNNIQLSSFACVHIQSACIIIIIMMTFRFNLLVL